MILGSYVETGRTAGGSCLIGRCAPILHNMSPLSSDIENSRLWRESLARREDEFNAFRERLRSSFLSFRDRAGILSAEIRKDCPALDSS